MVAGNGPGDAPEGTARRGCGPYLFSVLRDSFTFPIQGRFGKHLGFNLRVTYANHTELEQLPLAVLLNGFQVSMRVHMILKFKIS
jgi:hypothetical protein